MAELTEPLEVVAEPKTRRKVTIVLVGVLGEVSLIALAAWAGIQGAAIDPDVLETGQYAVAAVTSLGLGVQSFNDRFGKTFKE